MLPALDEKPRRSFGFPVRRLGGGNCGVLALVTNVAAQSRAVAAWSLRLAARMDAAGARRGLATRHELRRDRSAQGRDFLEGRQAATDPRGVELSDAGGDHCNW